MTSTFDDIAQVATDHPLVYMGATEAGGLALVVFDGDVTHVALPELTAARVGELASALAKAYQVLHATAALGQHRWDAALDEITRALWDLAVEPVLAAVLPAESVVLVAGGQLGALPLHAAWTPDDARPTGRRYALDDSVIRYVPNARSLLAAMHLASGDASRLLAVVDPTQPDPDDQLPMARAEAHSAVTGFASGTVWLEADRATSDEVRAVLPDVDVAHFACHGYADLGEPLSSGLLLAGGTSLTMRELLEMRLQLRLAVLSACETSVAGARLPDEVMALPTALLQAGVGGVVASHWAVPDTATAIMMTEFYRRWRWERQAPPHALRDAQVWVRDSSNSEKRAFYEAAASGNAPWLAHDTVEVLLRELTHFAPEARDHAGIDAWGAFAYIGA